MEVVWPASCVFVLAARGVLGGGFAADALRPFFVNVDVRSRRQRVTRASRLRNNSKPGSFGRLVIRGMNSMCRASILDVSVRQTGPSRPVGKPARFSSAEFVPARIGPMRRRGEHIASCNRADTSAIF
eukprot:scaffold45744_cov66-Phaeocystis_antarctica.AAC.2